MSKNEPNKETEQEETDKEKPGVFSRAWNYITSSRAAKFMGRMKDKVANSRLAGFITKVQNSKAYKVITSPAVSRVFSLGFSAVNITLAALTLSGVSIGIAAGFVLAPQIAIPLAVASIAAVAIGAAVDSYMVSRTRKLHSESKHLSRHRLAKDVQDQILTKDPKLAKVLGDKLYKPEREGKKSVKDRYASNASKTKSTAGAVALGVATTAIANTASLVEGIINRNPATIIKAVGSSTVGMGTSSYHNVTMSDKRREFREHIDKLRDQEDGPGYNNMRELKEAARKQKIQSLALRELVKDESYKSCTDDEIRRRFANIIEKIENTEKAIRSNYAITSVAKDFLKAHNPFSKYNNPEKLTTKLKTQELQITPKTGHGTITKKVKKAAHNLSDRVKDIKSKKKATRKTTQNRRSPSASGRQY